jgi:pimeloyl-ACP methyl ester carboxylesterase
LALAVFWACRPRPSGIVLFAHGSGSSRFSRRNNYVAALLQGAGFATLLFDLLSEEEGEDREKVFDIPLLAERLKLAAGWLADEPELADLKLGYFGASTGSAAALIAAATGKQKVRAIVSRGGRPDLADAYLLKVEAPTLLIVGGNDFGVIELNQTAFDLLTCEKALEIVPGATHLFEEPGALDQVANLAAQWFRRFLGGKKEVGR